MHRASVHRTACPLQENLADGSWGFYDILHAAERKSPSQLKASVSVWTQ
jgi:hypothetical protein